MALRNNFDSTTNFKNYHRPTNNPTILFLHKVMLERELTAADIIAIAEYLNKTPEIKQLDLSLNQLNTELIQLLAEKLNTTIGINLDSNNVGKKGLLALLKNQKINELNLMRNNIEIDSKNDADWIKNQLEPALSANHGLIACILAGNEGFDKTTAKMLYHKCEENKKALKSKYITDFYRINTLFSQILRSKDLSQDKRNHFRNVVKDVIPELMYIGSLFGGTDKEAVENVKKLKDLTSVPPTEENHKEIEKIIKKIKKQT
jgi:hypothetical protein